MDKVYYHKVRKDLHRLPLYIFRKFQVWVEQIEMLGLGKVQKYPGWNDELLKGTRKGQRSVRLSRSYRVIYEVERHQYFNVINVIEVNKHRY